MKNEKILVLLVAILCVSSMSRASNYVQNRAPLAEVPFTPLPIGSVKAEGWLLTQLQLQKSGLTGHAEELYNNNNDLGAGCDWLGGTGNSWERAPYYTKGLVALAYVLDDQELKTKAQKWIDWSLNNQRSRGYFGPVNNNDWWARMPMLYAIRDYYEATGDNRVIPFFTNYFKYQNSNIDNQQLSSWGKSRAGDNIEIVFWLYNRTGDDFLLELADKLHNQAYPWTNIFTNNLFNQFAGDFQPKHNVNVPQALKMPAIYYQKSHSQEDRNAYFAGREHLLHDHGQPHGMESGSEMVCGKSSMTGLELCSVVEQMQTSETAQMILGDASIGDQLEKVTFNALPGGLNYDITGLQYYQQANQVISKLGYTGFAQNYDNGNMPSPYSGYGCCRFDFHMGWPYFVKTMWAATADNGLAVMAYGPSRVTAYVADSVQVSIHETTDYPFGNELNFTLTVSESVIFPLKFRIPAWCSAPEIKVNGVLQNNVVQGQFYTINRTWNNNDAISIHFPMSLIINEEVNNSISIQRGPLVFSLKIDEIWSPRNDYGNGFQENEVLPASAWNYALVIDKNNPAASIQVVESSMPENPYIQGTTPVKLLVSARKLSSWNYAHNGRLATDPPYGPVETPLQEEQVTLVPYGAETLRATCLPYVGVNNLITNTFTENFESGQAGWVQYGGSWYVKDGEYVAGTVEASHPCSKTVYTATQFSDFVYEAKMQINSDHGDAGLMFRANRFSFGPDDYNGYYVGISSANNKVELGKADGSWHSLTAVTMDINANQWYNVKIVASGANLKVYVNDMTTPKINFTDSSFSSGSIGLRSWDALARWDNIAVRSLSESGISESAGKEFSIFPNPVNNWLSINIPHNGQLAIFDTTGKQLYAADVFSGTTTLNTNRYETGIYLVKLVTNEGTSCARFLKQDSWRVGS
ncbi:MAG: glycoside hydrolase family 127 protein [Dysgonamonadaceae bacterium]|jgi:hypothetical protein|nr:glycoside hydrolase family 127 protein [Dysgonamonadaceae bacterium]